MAYHTVKTLLTALLTTVEAELESAWSPRTIHSRHPHTWIHFQLWEEAGETRSETVACLFTPQLPVLKIKLKLDRSCPAHLSPVIQTHTADVLTLRAGSPQVHSLRWAATPVTDESARLNFPPHFTLSSWSWSHSTSSHWSSAPLLITLLISIDHCPAGGILLLFFLQHLATKSCWIDQSNQ